MVSDVCPLSSYVYRHWEIIYVAGILIPVFALAIVEHQYRKMIKDLYGDSVQHPLLRLWNTATLYTLGKGSMLLRRLGFNFNSRQAVKASHEDRMKQHAAAQLERSPPDDDDPPPGYW